ncbi:1-acyl-sn-glycerol-3-phosphate acyltransferase [Salicibibacter cibarius]|uniref:1-acyl-sn-glycerol-3-phosphate acyltransferase n=1 Tax=Salicibibacter cibarius TaxID=2743000 RepID=A0A7T7CBN8_9BACI|nr:lysophospholipid acyltransferase family protein [Salicibibacter cibarius]QQK76083.1 1-acyl-sn-glycerol-3-phosphate acyltransferase [Salicibibacter cibarius]
MVYWLLKSIGIMVSHCLYKINMIGQERIPKGSFIIAANHHSIVDPIIISGMFKQPIHFLAKSELFIHPFANWFLRRLHAIPIDRKSGIVIRPVRHSLKVIERGEWFGIFPEGKRCKIGETVRPKKGVAFLSRKSSVPILPVAIVWGNKTLWRAPVTIVIGKPINPGHFPNTSNHALAQLVMDQIKDLADKEGQRAGNSSENNEGAPRYEP